MSKKHEKRTREEILAKRTGTDLRCRYSRTGRLIVSYGPEVHRASRSKYTPHFGLKQQRKVLSDALKFAA